MAERPVIVIGAGHNGLIAACYLARAGRPVLVLEALDRPGGGSRTEERVPGFFFDLHSVAHNIINMTRIPEELDLTDAGLVYSEMNPFSIAVHEDGRRVRFFRSVEETVASIAEVDRGEADAYRRFMDVATPLIQATMPSIRGESSARETPRRIARLLQVARTGPLARTRDLLGPYDSLLRRWLPSDLTRGPVAAFAAHAGVGPGVGGSALFAFWQAAYHLHGQWHAQGGSQGLTDALVVRAASLGVEIRCDARIDRVDTAGGHVRAVTTGDGERITADTVISAIDPKHLLLDLVDPPLAGAARRDIAAVRRANVVQALVHVATDRLPPYPDAQRGDWNGLQSYVDRLEDLSRAWETAEAGELPDPLPLYSFTTSAIDPYLAPPGQHAVYLACPSAPATVSGGWATRREEFVDRALDTLESRAPGFRDSIIAVRPYTPEEMMAGGWVGAHPMHVDIGLDQLGPFRPTRRLSSHRTSIAGLYLSGAGTSPTGGIAGTPGKLAAKAVLDDTTRHRR
ncbi:MAG: NAD(P)/FAD-dependent oxidoreductase [Actinomycetota bacterium]|nr:NAD(P)/FAD-dependent oxidoreductase [Actinomycetota bacterium]